MKITTTENKDWEASDIPLIIRESKYGVPPTITILRRIRIFSNTFKLCFNWDSDELMIF